MHCEQSPHGPRGGDQRPPNRGRAAGRARPLWIPDSEVAALLGVARSTVWRWLDAGLVPAPRRVGGRTLWCREEIELFARCRSLPEFERQRRLLGPRR